MQQSWVSLLNSYNLILVVFRKDSKSWLFMEETAQQMKRPFGIPEKPEFTVGLDEPLKKLKTNVLSEGLSVMVLTGVGGLGKTTLATMLYYWTIITSYFFLSEVSYFAGIHEKFQIIVERTRG